MLSLRVLDGLLASRLSLIFSDPDPLLTKLLILSQLSAGNCGPVSLQLRRGQVDQLYNVRQADEVNLDSFLCGVGCSKRIV